MKKVKIIQKKKWQFCLAAVVLLLAVSQFAFAGPGSVDFLDRETNFSVSNHLSDGYIQVTMPIYEADGKDEGLPYHSANGGTHLLFNGTPLFYIYSMNGNDQWQGEDTWYWARIKRVGSEVVRMEALVQGRGAEEVSADYYSYHKFAARNGKKECTATFKIYLDPKYLADAKSFNYSFNMYIDVNSDGDSNFWMTGLAPGSVSASGYSNPTINTPVLSTTPEKYDVTFSASGAKDGSSYRWGASGNYTEGKNATIQFDISELAQSKTLYYKYYVSPYQTVTKSASVNLPEYPLPKNLKATSQTGGIINLAWDMATTTKTGVKLDIQRSDKADFTGAITVVSDYNITNKSYQDDVSELNLNGDYYYRIRRNDNNWGWNVFSSTSLEINTVHKTVDSTWVNLEGNKATIEWFLADSTNGIWTKNSKICINRINITAGGSKETIEVPIDSLSASKNKGRFTDELFIMCNNYRYEVYVQPGSSNFQKVDNPISTEIVTPVEQGNLESITVSKGYFSERVEVEWTSDGGTINEFVVLRREHGTSDEFKQVGKVEGSVATTYYKYDDTYAVPGVIYDYKIMGIIRCADELLYTSSTESVGFRTPTGDIYGRVTFDNGQAVEGVEINVVTEENMDSKSLEFTETQTAYVYNTDLLKENVDSVTIQAWISPSNTTGTQLIVSKSNMYELGIEDNKFFFKAGTTKVLTDTLTVSDVKNIADFMHITGVYDGTNLSIYIDGRLINEKTMDSSIIDNDEKVTFGGNYAGIIDEVRIWNISLTAEEIKRDYNRYLTGGEKGLIAYWTFNYAVDTEFYDISYSGVNFNQNHGSLNNVTLTNSINKTPSADQLGCRGVTAADGSYAVRSIPYKGSGTPYQIIPRMGIHQFQSEVEIRNIGLGSQSHTVDFIDVSSFRVAGFITYENSIIPVEGVNFNIDGQMALQSNGMPYQTNADGAFEIMVPVGVHEVMAVKANHTFVNDGRITDQYGNDLNYQDARTGIELKDNTTIKYIGRVAGGTIQEDYPIGHSLSTNNLAEGVTLTLTHIKTETLIFDDVEKTEVHFKPSNKDKANENTVKYAENKIIISPNEVTGEFVAYVIPEIFTISVNAPGHTDISGSGSQIDLTQQFNVREEIYAYKDSIQSSTENWDIVNYSDTVRYQFAQKFIKRYAPTIRITQIDRSNKPLLHFGADTTLVTNMLGETEKVPLYSNNNEYTFEKPVFVQHEAYNMHLKIFEEYVFYDAQGDATGTTDEVPTQDATIKFNNDIASNDGKTTEVTADEDGIAYYSFIAGDPEMTSAIKTMNATVTINESSGSTTSFAWIHPNNFLGGAAYVLGSRLLGTDFVTAGPDKILTVLRDPPGSNSYSYLEKGLSFEESSTYTGSVKNSGAEDFTTGVELPIISWHGVGSGVINIVQESGSGVTLGISHEEEYTGQDTKKTKTTTTTRFETSNDPLYVGANGDLYIGYSTNISFGATENITIVPRERFDEALGAYGTPYSEKTDWVMVKSTGISASQMFSTLFAYPQVHIEERLIPELEQLRNRMLLQPGEYNIDDLQIVANEKDTVFYISYFTPDNEHFGKSNDDESLETFLTINGDKDDEFNGPSYRVIFNPESAGVSDTIMIFNQYIDNWVEQLKNNEKQKVEAELIQNYSFHAGSSIEYSEAYSSTKSHESSFHIMLGGKISNDWKLGAGPAKTKFEFTETVETSHGGTFTSEVEASHCKGFVLAEDGDDDYLTVDVCHEKDWSSDDEDYDKGGSEGSVDEDSIGKKDYYSSFIFKTKAGVTSCPYEGEYVTKYYQPGQHIINQATRRLEVPEIDMPVKFIENIPSGETAKLQLYLRNNSEVQEDVWFDLKIIDSSNPDGAKMHIDGGAIGNGRAFLVPAGETLIKTLEVGKGAVMNYDDLQLILQSQCQYDPTNFLEDIADTVTFTVHFTPSCTDLVIKKPSNNWTYNTKLPVVQIDGVDKHYMDIIIDQFNVNYDNFHHIELQYKSASQSDEEWITLMNYYNDTDLFDKTVENGLNAEMIDAANKGTIPYRFFMDDMSDQYYDIRAVSVCDVNNEFVYNESEVSSGIKDMYRPRLFGSAQPANGILTIHDDVRLNFNEQIAEGLLTRHNFQVRAVRNGSESDHSVSVRMDGVNDYMATEFEKNLEGKDITVEMWIQADEPQNATLFSHGNINESLEMAITTDNRLKITIGSAVLTSIDPVPFEQGSWAHVAMVYEASGYLTAYYNYSPVINRTSQAGAYSGIGNIVLGKSISGNENNYAGKIHNVRIWEKSIPSTTIQLNSLVQLSGNEASLVAYYPMNEGKGTLTEDKARGATLIMEGGEWVMPDGYAIATNGDNYLKIETGTAGITKEMDYTIEFWFKAEPGQRNATMLSNGVGDGSDLGGSTYYYSIGFDANGSLSFINNGVTTVIDGDYQDNNWHHFALAVNRTYGRAQVYMNGNLTTYIDAANLGGISSAYTFLGARGWYSNDAPGVLVVDNHFVGKFDDLRFWELYKNERMVSENNNVKLTGEELGLIHYYPFDTYIEFQGQKFLEFTNKDMRISSGVNKEEDEFIVEGSSEDEAKSKEIAPLKDFGPVADLEFDFVVNDDALIINLLEPEYKIAKTIVTFTVTDVRDVNGNSIASPITWSAYIDRNQLKWSEEILNLTKPIYEELEFTVRAVNNGGSIQKYTINNMPSWLDITPSNGTLNPSSYEEITFVVNEGLNVGTYNEVVYLTNEDDVSEALTLNLVVMGEKPNWEVDPADFKFNMSVFGKMRFNNIFSADKGDMLAAFKNGTCVGVTTSIYDKKFDMWYALLTVYGNEKNYSGLEFRMWDASTGKTYKAIPDSEIIFINDAVYGDVDNPVIFDGKEIFYQNMNLVKGWNWVSFNLASDDLTNVNKTLQNGKWTKSDVAKSKDYFDSYSATKNTWTGTLSRNGGFNNTSMFMILSSQEQTLSTSGMTVDTRITPITVKGNQWNYIGYLPSVNTTVKEALAGYDAQKGDIIKSQDAFAMYSKNEWVGNLNYMEANKGYMLYRTKTNDVTFIYPTVSGSLSNKVLANLNVDKGYTNHQFAYNMNMVATTEGLRSSDKILVYISGELRGVGKYILSNESDLSFITIMGDEKEASLRFDLERDGQVIGSINSEIYYAPNTTEGTVENPVLLDFNLEDDNTSIYPNPFRTKFTVSLTAEVGSEVNINVIDITGRYVLKTNKQIVESTITNIDVDTSAIESGIYVVQVVVNGVASSYKVEKVK